MKFFERLLGRPYESSSGKVAKERLRLVHFTRVAGHAQRRNDRCDFASRRH
jgi:septum formation topological specificity factor MinE